MNKNTMCTKRLDCLGTSKTLIFEFIILGQLVLGDLIDFLEDTFSCVLENCNNSQPLIMESDFEVEDIATPMALVSKLEDFGNESIPLLPLLYTCLLSQLVIEFIRLITKQIFHGIQSKWIIL
jgi:hypothetical protein